MRSLSIRSPRPSRHAVSSGRVERAAVTACQPLESRLLMAIDILWTNRATTDNFGIFGSSAAQARTIVDRAIADWEAVITSFNRSGGSNTFSVSVSAGAIDGRGVSNVTGLTNGKPSVGTMTMDDNGGGANWYFDTFVGVDGTPDDGEFNNPISPFTSGGTGITGADFYRTAVHELGHLMGIYNGGLVASFATDVGDDPNSGDAADRLLGIDTNNNGIYEYTLTTDGGGHLFEGGGSYTGPSHPNALMNSGRTYVNGRRQLIGTVESQILAAALGYSVVDPDTINTFWANLNRTSDTLTVSGDINPNGSDNDSIIIDVVGTDLRVQVGGTTELIPIAEFDTLVVNAGLGNDTIRVDELPSAKTVTINGEELDDTIILAEVVQDVDTNLLSNLTINGGTGVDSIRIDDQTDGAGGDFWTIAAGSLNKNGTIVTYSGAEGVTINGSAQATTWNINGTNTPLVLVGGAGSEDFNVGGGDFDTNINADVTVDPNGGTDRVTVSDTLDDISVVDTYEVNSTSFTKNSAAGAVLSWFSGLLLGPTGLEEFVLNANEVASTINVNSTGTTSFLTSPPTNYPIATTINAGAGNDTIVVSTTSGQLTSIRGNLVINGNADTDSLRFNDTSNAAATTLNLTHNTLVTSAWSYLANFFTIEALTLDAGSAVDTINYTSGGVAPASLVLNGNGAADTFNVIEGAATVHGGAGLDDVNINISETGTASVTVNANENWDQLLMNEGSTLTVAANGHLGLDVQSAGNVRGILNLNDNYMVNRTNSESFLLDKVTRGYNSGGWNGVPAGAAQGVIRSDYAAGSALKDALSFATIGGAAGQLNKAVYGVTSLFSGNILIAHTLYGDADIDRDTDFNDLLRLAANFNASPKNWTQGNFNYDTTTNFNDLLLLAASFNQSLPAASAPLPAAPAAGSDDVLADGPDRQGVLGSTEDDVIV